MRVAGPRSAFELYAERTQVGCHKSPKRSEEPCVKGIRANNEAETRLRTSKPAPLAQLLWERHSSPMPFVTARGRASPPRGDKRLKPLPTTTQQRKVRPRNPRRPLGSCGRGVHANNEAETRSSISKPAPPARLCGRDIYARCSSSRCEEEHRPQEGQAAKAASNNSCFSGFVPA